MENEPFLLCLRQSLPFVKYLCFHPSLKKSKLFSFSFWSHLKVIILLWVLLFVSQLSLAARPKTVCFLNGWFICFCFDVPPRHIPSFCVNDLFYGHVFLHKNRDMSSLIGVSHNQDLIRKIAWEEKHYLWTLFSFKKHRVPLELNENG